MPLSDNERELVERIAQNNEYNEGIRGLARTWIKVDDRRKNQ